MLKDCSDASDSVVLHFARGYTFVMQIETVSDTYHRITFSDGSQLFLVGTAHVSSNSVDQVKAVIEEENPDTVCIELDTGRMQSKQSSWQDQDIRKVFKEKKGFLLLANTALASFQKRLGAQTGTAPGEELLGAARLAKEKGIPLSLCDRDIQTTFRRAWAKSSLWNKCKLLATLISTAFSDEKISEEELEDLKKQETLENMLNEMAKELPSIKEVLIDERDIYLATKMFTTPGEKKVGVIGAGHTKGILSALEKLDRGETLKSLEERWTQGLTTFLYWIAVNAGCTLIATTISLAHPLNILACSVTAPFFALNPVLGVGMLGGILEATFRKPKVKDFQDLNDDAVTFKGWYRNRILHCLLVFFFSSIGSVIGTFVAFPMLIARI